MDGIRDWRALPLTFGARLSLPHCTRYPLGSSILLQPDGAVFTTSQGKPVEEPYAAERIGPNGPLLLQDFHLIDV